VRVFFKFYRRQPQGGLLGGSGLISTTLAWALERQGSKDRGLGDLPAGLGWFVVEMGPILPIAASFEQRASHTARSWCLVRVFDGGSRAHIRLFFCY